MRIRTIKPEFFKSDRIAELDPMCRLLFIGLWCCADANGAMENRHKRLKAEILPYDDIDIGAALQQLESAGYITLYESGCEQYILVNGFRSHQRITGKEAANGGRYPLPGNDLHSGKQLGNNGETPGKQPDAQEQGARNKEQGAWSKGYGVEGNAQTRSLIHEFLRKRLLPCGDKQIDEWIILLRDIAGCTGKNETQECLDWILKELPEIRYADKARALASRWQEHKRCMEAS